MSETTEKMTLKELEKQFQEMRERYEEKIRDLEARLTEKAEIPPAPTTPKKKKNASDWLNEEVTIRLFKDSDRYKDDLTIGINGRLVKIRRGETVRIKRKYCMLIDESMRQDEKTAEMMNRESRRFETESRVYEA